MSQLYVDAVLEAQAEADAAGKNRTVEMTKEAVGKRKRHLPTAKFSGLA
jgi:hypothetical protein